MGNGGGGLVGVLKEAMRLSIELCRVGEGGGRKGRKKKGGGGGEVDVGVVTRGLQYLKMLLQIGDCVSSSLPFFNMPPHEKGSGPMTVEEGIFVSSSSFFSPLCSPSSFFSGGFTSMECCSRSCESLL